jgi:2-oxoglutarate ferredoxin oxidoreductase subunit alpha
MKKEFTITIAGEAGQGMQTIGMALCEVFKNQGCHIFANQDYMSRIRGGNNYFQIRISNIPVYALRQKFDIIVVLDKNSVQIHKNRLTQGGLLIADKKHFGLEDIDIFDIPFYEIAKNYGSEIFVSSVACGIISAITRLEFENIENQIKQTFSDKTQDIIEKNISAARQGYQIANENFHFDTYKIACCRPKNKALFNGNTALALGAISAGCKFYTAYPMTPSTSIMETIAHLAKQYNIATEQAEDEIAAINMAIGASFAGVRSMVGTSGGGFALMVEGVSLAGMTETPVVIVDAQRPAPATGFPTRTEQADLNFVLCSGHGEFARAVFTPGTIEQAFYSTIKAFDIAEKYQIPVVIMTDQHLADSYRDIEEFDTVSLSIKRHIITRQESAKMDSYKRYKITEDGISPRAIPSWIQDCIYADSDEHTEEGHITEDADVRSRMVEKRFYKKMDGLSKEIQSPEVYNADADTVLIGFGSTYGVLKETCENFKNKKIGFVHLSQVWPFPHQQIIGILRNTKTIINVENNAGSQLGNLIFSQTGIKPKYSILKYDGRPFDVDYLTQEIEKWV